MQVSPRVTHLAQLGVAHAGNRLVAVGERGSILLSDDRAKTWRQAASPVSVTLTAVAFADDKYGWAVGHSGVVLATVDGGLHWTKQLEGSRAAQIELAGANSAGTGDGEQAARRQSNAERLVMDGPDKPFFDVHFFDRKTGVIVGAYGLAFITHDGGANWESLSARIADQRGRHLYAIHAQGARIFIAGEQGALFRSDDEGASFRPLNTPSNATFFGLVGGPAGELVAFGLRGNAWRSDDCGASWSRLSFAPISLTAGSRLTDGSFLLLDESGRLMHSRDGARTFHPLAVPRFAPSSAIVQVTNSAVVIAGIAGVSRITLPLPHPETVQ